MASYKIEWKQSARKELKKLDPSAIGRLLSAVEPLADNPHPSGSKRLRGSEHTHRIRVGHYRIIYSVWASSLTIEVIKIGHRKEVYRELP